MTLWTRIKHAWAGFCRETPRFTVTFMMAADELETRAALIFYATKMMELPEMLTDDIATLIADYKSKVAAAEAAAASATAPLQAQVTDLEAKVADLQNQITAAEAAVQAGIAEVAPAAPIEPAPVDPNAPQA